MRGAEARLTPRRWRRQRLCRALADAEQQRYLNSRARRRAVRIKGSAVDLEDGETRILTLADADVLAGGSGSDGEAGEGDVLEDAGRARESEIARAKRCACSLATPVARSALGARPM